MASSVTKVLAVKVLADSPAFSLSGATKLILESPGPDDIVYVYEETATEGTYQKVTYGEAPHEGQVVTLHVKRPSFIIEGYGNYKFVLGAATSTDAVVGYVA